MDLVFLWGAGALAAGTTNHNLQDRFLGTHSRELLSTGWDDFSALRCFVGWLHPWVRGFQKEGSEVGKSDVFPRPCSTQLPMKTVQTEKWYQGKSPLVIVHSAWPLTGDQSYWTHQGPLRAV